jgi:hypothetical protein
VIAGVQCVEMPINVCQVGKFKHFVSSRKSEKLALSLSWKTSSNSSCRPDGLVATLPLESHLNSVLLKEVHVAFFAYSSDILRIFAIVRRI